MNTLFGIPIVTSPYITPQPVLRISHNFEWCSDGFRSDMNKWLLDNFGEREVMYIMQTPAGQRIAMSPKHAAMLTNFLP